jgi:hypothetical protein
MYLTIRHPTRCKAGSFMLWEAADIENGLTFGILPTNLKSFSYRSCKSPPLLANFGRLSRTADT